MSITGLVDSPKQQKKTAPPHAPLYLIDALGPFLSEKVVGRGLIDHSDVPWDRLESLSPKSWADFFETAGHEMNLLARSVRKIGYTGLIVGDVTRLVDHESLDPVSRQNVKRFRKEFLTLFQYVREKNLDVFVNLKIGKNENVIGFLEKFFRNYPSVRGVILQFSGHGLGSSVQPESANRLLRELLLVFEKYKRLSVFRTWTDGTGPQLDLIWDKANIEQTVAGINNSRSLILSFRYSEVGDYRYTSLNRNFLATDLPKIVELPARREHEGCGEFPGFVGHDYEKYAIELRGVPHMLGVAVTCQTGGKSKFRRRAFIDEDAIWTDINAFVILRLFQCGELVEEAVSRLPGVTNPMSLAELLRLSEEVVRGPDVFSRVCPAASLFSQTENLPFTGCFWSSYHCLAFDSKSTATARQRSRTVYSLRRGCPGQNSTNASVGAGVLAARGRCGIYGVQSADSRPGA